MEKMESSLDTLKSSLSEHCINKNLNRYLYSIPLERLNKMGIRSWTKNRDVDIARVKEIAASIKSNGRMVGIIHLAQIGSGLSCFDGNHRRRALAQITTPIENPLVMIMWNASLNDIVAEFNNINLAVSVSSIHLENGMSSSDKLTIKTYVTGLATKYPTMTSSAARCNRPHFNRDVLEQDLFDLLQEDSTLTASQLVNILNLMNEEYLEGEVYPPSGTRADANAKCSTYGLWLFCDGRTVNRRHFNRVRKQVK